MKYENKGLFIDGVGDIVCHSYGLFLLLNFWMI